MIIEVMVEAGEKRALKPGSRCQVRGQGLSSLSLATRQALWSGDGSSQSGQWACHDVWRRRPKGDIHGPNQALRGRCVGYTKSARAGEKHGSKQGWSKCPKSKRGRLVLTTKGQEL